ncbi:hypothetical protein Q8P09_03160 [Psychrobacter faecalis]|uniref:Uncharacterized protein n=1 Tax=Psychrobacter faecalis TaxID=180588 RepID=A0ABT9HE83_9GAMM|nr:hypothetical protein [Psychrobacter faecalis]MDP4544077.1 hypothetical protein [Psychrobacter faecalis]
MTSSDTDKDSLPINTPQNASELAATRKTDNIDNIYRQRGCYRSTGA